MIRSSLYIILFLICLMPIGSQHGAQGAIEDTREALERLEDSQAEQLANKKTLAQKAKQEALKLNQLKQTLRQKAAETRDVEQDIVNLEDHLEDIGNQQKQLNQKLRDEKNNLAELTLALQRLARTPPESLLAKPGSPIQTARAQTVLQGTLPQVQKKSEEIASLMQTLEQLATQQETKKAALIKQKNTLAKQQEKLSSLYEEREKFYKTYQTQADQYQKKAQKIALQARDLKGLLNKLEHTQSQVASLGSIGKKPTFRKPRKSSLSLFNDQILPVAGAIQTAFGQKNELGVTNKGLDIESRGGLNVISPLGGRVKFAGPFKNYRNIVIIEHDNDLMSLIGGIDQINVGLNQDIDSGEPVGRLGNALDKPILYFELRKNGEQIDPVKYLSELAKGQQKT